MPQGDRTYEIGIANDEASLTDDQMKSMFATFIGTFRKGPEYIYRTQVSREEKSVKVSLEDIESFSHQLFEEVVTRPLRCVDLFRAALRESEGARERGVEIVSHSPPTPIRRLDAQRLNKIATVRGIVVSVSSVSIRPVILHVFCRNCLNAKTVKDVLPRKCESCAGTDTFVASPEKSVLQDTQMVKLQELFEDLPPGDTPRHLLVLASAGLVDRVAPGVVAHTTGILSVGGTRDSGQYLRALGLEASDAPILRGMSHIPRDNLRQGVTRDLIVRSIAPEVFGNGDVKLALACALFGGSRKIFADGVTVRGDINVLLLGDPGIAKSQMLKFLAGVSGRGVYTSGKGASAAGLTASVCRNKSGGFYLEGGALVLADGGLCCIDEFDKMQEKDRVAIHEAMEQQTISISKAGIVTSLNSRCAVVAAANPIFGRYDENRAPGENIDFGATILSRFDLVFVIRDTLGRDREIAEHVLARSLQKPFADTPEPVEDPEVMCAEELRAYAEHARSISPEMDPAASLRLQSYYVQTRKLAKESATDSTVPITVRQLEAICRVSEALARMELAHKATEEHVEEAIRLFGESTMKAVSMGHCIEGMPRKEWVKEFSATESAIRRLLPVGVSRPYRALLSELLKDHNEGVVVKCLDAMVRSERISLMGAGKYVVRMP